MIKEMEGQIHRKPRGLFIPAQIFLRDLSVGTDSASGHTVATEHLAYSFIGIL